MEVIFLKLAEKKKKKEHGKTLELYGDVKHGLSLELQSYRATKDARQRSGLDFSLFAAPLLLILELLEVWSWSKSSISEYSRVVDLSL